MDRIAERSSVPALVASVLGIGYMGRGGGTVAAAVMALLWLAVDMHGWPPIAYLGGVVALITVGVRVAGRLEQGWGHDSGMVVVDEYAGMALALFLLPGGWPVALLAFLLFRAFDIAKPLGIARLERLPGGWGVMADDLLAGLYANLIMQGIVRTNLWTWI